MKKRKYYPNNWQAIKDCPPNYFPSMPFDEFREWKVFGYNYLVLTTALYV